MRAPPAFLSDSPRPPRRDLLVLSHVRWSAASERVRRIVSGLGASHRVVWVEQPLRDGSGPSLQGRHEGGVQIIVPHVGRHATDTEICALFDRLVSVTRLHRPIGWYLSPALRPASRHLPFSLLVWDRCDEPMTLTGLTRAETELLGAADLVFAASPDPPPTLGPNSKISTVPIAVDVETLARVREPLLGPAQEKRHVPWRIACLADRDVDHALVAGLARLHVGWRIVVAGTPDRSAPLPANVIWRRPQDVIESADVTILPLLPGHRTTAAAELAVASVAAGRPVVASSCVAAPRALRESGWVRVADGVAGFAQHLGALVAQGVAGLPPRRDVVRPYSYGTVVERIRSRLDEALADRLPSSAEASARLLLTAANPRVRPRTTM